MIQWIFPGRTRRETRVRERKRGWRRRGIIVVGSSGWCRIMETGRIVSHDWRKCQWQAKLQEVCVYAVILWCFKKPVKVTTLSWPRLRSCSFVCARAAHWWTVSGCWAALYIGSIFTLCWVLLSSSFLTLRHYLNTSVPHLAAGEHTPLPPIPPV